MNASSKEGDSPKRQKGNTNNNANTSAGKGIATSSSSQATWLRLKDPRIVRVSRAYGGKDRHSKVCTIRGLRDRRVRLSVPTAIQLYDLQDRLGLNQPSKVVDWLLNAAKDEIDELPPLPIPPENLGLNHHQMMVLASQEATAGGGGAVASSFWNSDAFGRGKSKEVMERGSETSEKENWKRRSTIEQEEEEGEKQAHDQPNYGSNFYHHFDPSNFPLSHLGSHGFASSLEHQHHHLHGFNVASPLSLVCPPPPVGTTQTFFPNSHASSSSLDIDPRHISPYHFQMLRSTSDLNSFPNLLNPSAAFYSLSQANVRPFSLNITPRPPHNNSGNQAEKEHGDDDFSSK